MEKLIIIKLGGSLITDKNKEYSINETIISNICNEIKGFSEENNTKLIISHGSGSFGHIDAKKYKTIDGVKNRDDFFGFCKVQNKASDLNKIIVSNLIKQGISAFPIQPSAISLCKNKIIQEIHIDSIINALNNKLIPVIYGDVCFDETLGGTIISTEDIIGYLSKKLIKRYELIIILFGKVDGVLDDKNEVIKLINNENYEKIEKHLKGSDGIDVTGGMRQKVEKMLELTKLGIKIKIVNGTIKNNILNSLLLKNVDGTLIE